MENQQGEYRTRRAQHNRLLRDLASMRRMAHNVAELTVADAWEDEAIEFARWVMDVMDEIYYRAERLEDQGQLPLF